MTNKKYRLLKDLPDVKAGAEFYMSKGLDAFFLDSHMTGTKLNCYAYPKQFVENNPEWFEEIKEPEWEIVQCAVPGVAPHSYDKTVCLGASKEVKRCQIYSVRRKSDGQVFSVGEITDGNNKIFAFELLGDKLSVHMQTVSQSYPTQGWLSNIQSLTKRQNKEPEKVIVDDFEFDVVEKWMKFHFVNLNTVQPTAYREIKQAIEDILNNNKRVWVSPGEYFSKNVFTKQQVDEAEEKAFNEARWTNPIVGFKYDTFEDYKKQNP